MDCTQIANNLAGSISTISTEILRNKGGKGYRPKKADHLTRERFLLSRNTRRIEPGVLKVAFDRIALRLSAEHVFAELPISHETIYQHNYAENLLKGLFGRV